MPEDEWGEIPVNLWAETYWDRKKLEKENKTMHKEKKKQGWWLIIKNSDYVKETGFPEEQNKFHYGSRGLLLVWAYTASGAVKKYLLKKIELDGAREKEEIESAFMGLFRSALWSARYA